MKNLVLNHLRVDVRSLGVVVLLALLAGSVPVTGKARPAFLQAGSADPILVIDPETVEGLLGEPGIRILDARRSLDYREGHLPGAVITRVDLFVDTDSRIEGALVALDRLGIRFGVRGIAKNTHVIVYDNAGGELAARIAWVLHYLGHQLVSVVEGGYSRWDSEGRPVTREVLPLQRAEFPVDPSPRRIADADWVLEHMDDSGVVMIDARIERIYERDHIPGAINIPWSEFLDDEAGWWKSNEELESMLTESGVSPDKDVMIYGHTGEMAALPYLVLKVLGYPRVRIYDRGWAEWSKDITLPKAGRTNPPEEALKAMFRVNGCVECHQILPSLDTMRRSPPPGCSVGCHAPRDGKPPTFPEVLAAADGLELGCRTIMETVFGVSEASDHVGEVNEAHFADHGCAQCHDARGNGQTAANLNPRGLEMRERQPNCIDMMFVLN